MSGDVFLALSAFAGGFSVALIAVALTRIPTRPASRSLYGFVATGVLWAVGDLIADTAPNMAWKQTGLVLLYSGSIWMPTMWWLLALRWAEGVRAPIPHRNGLWTVLPVLFAATMWLAMITNPWHGLFITPVVGGRNFYGPIWYAMAIPNYALIVAGFVLEIAVARHVPRTDVRRQASLMIGASAVTLLGNLIYVSGVISVNPTVLFLSVAGGLLVVGMAREGMFGVLPAALPRIADLHPDGLIVVGPNWGVRYANDRAKQLVDLRFNVPGSLIGCLRDALRLEEKQQPLEDDSEAAWLKALTLGDGLRLELPGSEPCYLRANAFPVIGRGGRLLGYWVRLSDITHTRMIELRERQTRRLESVANLARTISAELGGTLSVIRNNAEAIVPSPQTGPADERRVRQILDAAKRGEDLAFQLRLYTGTVQAIHVPIDFAEVVREMVDLTTEDLEGDIHVAQEVPATPLMIEADPIQVRHAVYELLLNAVEAMDEPGGEVRVEAGRCTLDPASLDGVVSSRSIRPGPFAFVRVHDHGGGMPPEIEERAFEPWFSTRGKDRGAGLATVLGVARAHDAVVTLENHVGSGCVVTLYLPLEGDQGLAPHASH